jgi:hypothetical protein
MTHILINIASGITVIVLAIFFIDWLFGHLLRAIWPDEETEKELARREMEDRLIEVNKEVHNRPRVRAGTCYNYTPEKS